MCPFRGKHIKSADGGGMRGGSQIHTQLQIYVYVCICIGALILGSYSSPLDARIIELCGTCGTYSGSVVSAAAAAAAVVSAADTVSEAVSEAVGFGAGSTGFRFLIK
jgi:hypothetical protein